MKRDNKAYKGWRAFDYYEWLLEKVNCRTAENYTLLLRDLHNIPFTWKVKMDSDRAADGCHLREVYLYEIGMEDEPHEDLHEDEVGCSVLEMLIAMADRFAYDVIGIGYASVSDWFWTMISNLGLLETPDYDYDPELVEEKVSIFLKRKYDRNGYEGMFPMRESEEDQRKVDLWTQMADWFNENYWGVKEFE